jgi:hypothetical protein
MDERRALRGLPMFGVAAGGMVLGHWLGYLLAIPDRAVRARVLIASGHSYWLAAVQISVALVAAGLVVLAVRQLRGGLTRTGMRTPRVPLLVRLAGAQISMFIVLEVIERLVVHEPLGQMFGHHLFLLGLLVQVVVASVGTRLVLWFCRTVERLAEWIGRPSFGQPRRTVRWPSVRFMRPVPVLAGAAGLRSPPSR